MFNLEVAILRIRARTPVLGFIVELLDDYKECTCFF